MALVRYIQFETQSVFTSETFSTFGPNAHVIDPIGEDITGDQQYIYPRTAGLRNIRGRVEGSKKWTGPLDTPMYSIHAPSLIYYAMGTAVTVTNSPTTSHNTHTITKADSLPFFKAGIGREINEHKYVGGIISGYTIDYSPDDVFTGSFDVVFRREISPLGTLDTSAAFPDYDDLERGFGGVEVQPRLASGDVNFIESASVTLENNVADDAYSLGSSFLPAGIIAAFGVTGSFDLRYDNNSRYTDWLDGTKVRFELNAQHGAAGTQRDVKFDFPKISYDVTRLPTDNIERYVQTLDFTAEPDTNGDPVVVTVINAQSNAQLTG